MNDGDIFSLQMDYDPEEYYDWYYNIDHAETEQILVTGIVRGLNTAQYNTYIEHISHVVRERTGFPIRNSGTIYHETTKSFFEHFRNGLAKRGYDADKYSRIAVHFWMGTDLCIRFVEKISQSTDRDKENG
jgi:hypothetical protein